MGSCSRKTTWLLVLAATFIVASAPPSLAGDAFLRLGVEFHPRDLPFEARWRGAFGSDYPMNIGETLFLGFEVQTSAYRQDVAMSTNTATIVPANGFINVKFKSGNYGTRPFAGGGIGVLSTFVWLSGDNSWERQMGYHFLGGVEFGRLSVELQMQRAFESGSTTSFAFYGGFVF